MIRTRVASVASVARVIRVTKVASGTRASSGYRKNLALDLKFSFSFQSFPNSSISFERQLSNFLHQTTLFFSPNSYPLSLKFSSLSNDKTRISVPEGTKENSSFKPTFSHRLSQNRLREARARRVPTSQLERFLGFGELAIGIGVGTLSEALKRIFSSEDAKYKNPVINEQNARRLADSLARLRGAALKLGQFLSLQDENLLPKELSDILERVRSSADYMPHDQLFSVLESELGKDWRTKFKEFDLQPIAAASIGQVHKAITKEGQAVAVKVQYPGVGESIESDVKNFAALLNYTGVIPKGFYLDRAVEVATKELLLETDYINEAKNQIKFKELIKNEPDYYVPEIISHLSTKKILTAELIEGYPIDKLIQFDKSVKDWVGDRIMKLCLKELFVWNFMQTDPNWANFFYNPQLGKLILLDFGASRQFPKKFLDNYLEVIYAAAQKDRESCLVYSEKLGFLTGEETKLMKNTHVDAVLILGEAFAVDKFEFGNQNLTNRIHQLIPTMLKHRLTPPPEETYSLHRKLSGAYLACAKLSATVECRAFFLKLYNDYHNS